MNRVALATCSSYPDLDADGPALLAALAAEGLDVTVAVWDDPSVDWDAFDLVVLRTVWDYILRHDEFLDWTRRVPRLANSADVVAWNTDKTYLRRLSEAGIPVVPTQWYLPGDAFTAPEVPFVVKPTVSAGSRDTARYGASAPEATAHVEALLAAGRPVMVQPYLEGVDVDGETAVLCFAGEVSHGVRKGALLEPGAGVKTDPDSSPPISPREPSAAESALAAQVLAVVRSWGDDLLYARVDLLPGPVLIELEVTEPALFLGSRQDPLSGSRRRFVVAPRSGRQVSPGCGREDQRRAEHVQADEHRRDTCEVLPVADPGLGDDQPDEHRGAALDDLRGGQRAGRHDGGERQAHEQEHQVGVQLGDSAGAEGQPLDLGVAGVRAGAGDEGAEDEDHRGRGHERTRQDAQLPSYRWGPRAGDALEQCGSPDDQREARQEVQDQHVRVQTRQHEQPTDDGLQRHHHRLYEGEPAPGLRCADADDRDEQGDAHQLHDHGDQAVAELDVAVAAEGRGVGQAAAGAAWPGRAAQAGAGDADGGAADDEQDLQRQRRPGEPPDGGHATDRSATRVSSRSRAASTTSGRLGG